MTKLLGTKDFRDSYNYDSIQILRWPISANTTNSSLNTTKYSRNTTNTFSNTLLSVLSKITTQYYPNTTQYLQNTIQFSQNTTKNSPDYVMQDLLTEPPNMLRSLRSRHGGSRVKSSLWPFCGRIPGPTNSVWASFDL